MGWVSIPKTDKKFRNYHQSRKKWIFALLAVPQINKKNPANASLKKGTTTNSREEEIKKQKEAAWKEIIEWKWQPSKANYHFRKNYLWRSDHQTRESNSD